MYLLLSLCVFISNKTMTNIVLKTERVELVVYIKEYNRTKQTFPNFFSEVVISSQPEAYIWFHRRRRRHFVK